MKTKLKRLRIGLAAVPGPKTFKEFPRIGHEPSVVRFPDEWKKAVNQFCVKAFAPIHPQ